MKKLVTICICVTVLLLTAACSLSASTTSAPSKTQIQKDLIGNSDMAGIRAGYLEKVTNFEITKRQTTPEGKIDTVWVHLEAENSDVSSQMYFIMSYGLYNDGWLLDSIVPDQTELWSFTPFRGVDEAVLQSYLPNDAMITSNNVDTVNGFQRVEYSYMESYPLCEVVYQQALVFYFGTEYYSSWAWDYVGIEDIGTYENWHIDGTWQYYTSSNSGTINAQIEIQGFAPLGIAYDSDSSNDSFVIPGSYSYYSWFSMMYGTDDYKDNGPFIVDCTPWANSNGWRYTINTSVNTYGNWHQVSVYRDKLILNSWNSLAMEMTKVDSVSDNKNRGKCGDNLTWSFSNDGVLTISGTGDMYDYIERTDNSVTYYNSPFKDIRDQVASIVIEDGVTTIGSGAFQNFTNLTSVAISSSVTSIEYSAFDCCVNLETIAVDSGNSYYSSNDGVLFNVNHTQLIYYPEGKKNSSYTIPNSTLSVINSGSINYSLTSITIPDSVTHIDSGAFANFRNLASITVDNMNRYYSSEDGVLFSADKTVIHTFPASKSTADYNIPSTVTHIEIAAFFGCTLTSVTIPSSVTTIDIKAFAGCPLLTNITVPSSVTSIGNFAFLSCPQLTDITIPYSVTSLGLLVFIDCYNLSDIYYGGSAEEWAVLAADAGVSPTVTIHYNFVG